MIVAITPLRSEAEQIIRELALLAILAPLGDAGAVGSVALDLIVQLDIDLYLVVGNGDLLAAVDEVYHRLLQDTRVQEVRITDYRQQGGLKIGIDSYPAASGSWSIDIWITDRPETTGRALLERLQRTLTAEQRETILAIKREFHRQGELRDGMSSLIYEAVADHGVRTAGEFREFLSRRRPVGDPSSPCKPGGGSDTCRMRRQFENGSKSSSGDYAKRSASDSSTSGITGVGRGARPGPTATSTRWWSWITSTPTISPSFDA